MKLQIDRKPEIRAFLSDLLSRKGDNEPFSDDSSLLLSGRLQSVDAVAMAVFLEEKFNVDFAAIGFDQEMIDSVNAVSSLIETCN